MATDDNWRAQMIAMLNDPGQREEVRKRLLNIGENIPVGREEKPVESKIFKIGSIQGNHWELEGMVF